MAEISWIGDHDAWRKAIDRIGGYDFYQIPGFIFQEAELLKGQAIAFSYQSGGVEALIPLIERKVESGNKGEWSDALSPYGYPGVLCSDPAALNDVVHAYGHAAHARGIVSTFIRLHPIHNSALVFEKKGLRQNFRGKTYSMDLSEDAETIRAVYASSHRRALKKLRKSGFQVVHNQWDLLPRWHEIYLETMTRLGAGDYYHFDFAYLERLRRDLKLWLVMVLDGEGEAACGGLFVRTNDIVQYHLGGTAGDFVRVAPSKLMFDEVVGELAGKGEFRWLHLGGGLGAREDNLATFKKRVSTRSHWFRTLEMIHHPVIYNNLSKGIPESGFFPLYRSV